MKFIDSHESMIAWWQELLGISANFLEGFGHRILALLVFCPDIAREITWNSGMQLHL